MQKNWHQNLTKRGRSAEKLAPKSHKEGQVRRKTGTKISQRGAGPQKNWHQNLTKRGRSAEKLAPKSHKEGQVRRKTGTKISQKHATAPVGTRHMGRVGVGEDSR